MKLAEIEASITSPSKLRRLFAKTINKLLIARIKDTGVLFSFFVSLSLIQQ